MQKCNMWYVVVSIYMYIEQYRCAPCQYVCSKGLVMRGNIAKLMVYTYYADSYTCT